MFLMQSGALNILESLYNAVQGLPFSRKFGWSMYCPKTVNIILGLFDGSILKHKTVIGMLVLVSIKEKQLEKPGKETQ